MNLKKEVKILEKELTEKEIKQRNKTIINNFFDEYARPPRKGEFIKIGGILTYEQRQNDYDLFLRDYGYMGYGKGNTKTFEVYTMDGKSIFIGTKIEIIDEFTLGNRNNFDAFQVNNLPFNNKYFIREKKIDLNRSYC